jgi:hypothetical protein
VSLDRDDIVRDDFPTARRGYDPEAVRTHLRSIADAVRERASTPLAETAADRVGSIIEAAEKQAAEIEAEARSEAERIVSAARREASEQVDRAQGAVSRLVDHADELRSAVGRLGSDIASQVGQAPAGTPRAETPAPPEIDPQPPVVPEPTPPLDPEPTPPQTPEPAPPLTPEPTPPQTPEPQPPGPQIAAGSPSTDDLLAQLKGEAAPTAGGRSKPGNGDAGNGAAAESATDGDVAAARLIAMKMALDGASRDEIAIHLEDNFSLSSTDELLDDVLARARA